MLLFNISDSLLFFSQTKTCPQCHHDDYRLQNKSRFLRFSIIPILPLAWRYQYLCNHCEHSVQLSIRQLPWLEKLSLIKYFMGFILLTWLCTYFYTQHLNELKTKQAILSQPQAFDTYLVHADKFSNEPLRPENLKVAQVLTFNDNTITFQISNYRYKRDKAITMAMRTSLLVQKDYFSSKTMTLPRNEVQRLYDEGTIYDVLRPHAYSLYGGFVMFPPRPKPLYEGVKLNKNNQQGITYYKDGLFKDAFESFLLASKEGSTWGQLNTAQMYRDGEGVKKDIAQAIYWYQQAALQNNPKAKVQLKELCLEHSCQ
ncbi:tetratricopeptide repeat protein [Pseudoalteromonas mariniglutinosa]|uniref:tetratricopeptide repeat protein n=1 Tax=Pseudoalteromonas mariniglutinosa TaxID=206042 RepID=UPI00384ABDC8